VLKTFFGGNYTNKKTQKTTALHSFEGEKLITMLFLTARTGEQGGSKKCNRML
jgi:hypothetical protein